MPFVFFIRPIVIKVRKIVANKKGLEYKPLMPKIEKRIKKLISRLKNK